jgi:Zn-dependent metalloprotease
VRGGVTTTSELVILPKGQRSAATRLVWRVVVSAENEVDGALQWDYFVDAKTGAVVWAFDSLETANTIGTARTQYLGSQAANLDLQGTTFFLRDVLRSAGI